MKTGLLAAITVGAALAGLILYYQKRLKIERNVLANSSDDFHSVGNGNGTMNSTRPAQHAMG